MADLDEDPLINAQSNMDEDHDPSDETQDFLLLASLTAKSGQIPKRGEKDFERHGTRHQDDLLSASRQAMHDALDSTRIHTPKTHVKAFYYGVEGLDRDEVVPEDWRKGIDDDHIVLIESFKGPHFRTLGKTTLGKKRTTMWLLPEEALYLLERGGLDLQWPSPSTFKRIVGDDSLAGGSGDQEAQEEEDEELPMSLQAGYALLIGDDSNKGKVSLDRYTVYTNLKRAGYVVLRAPEWDPNAPGPSPEPAVATTTESPSIFTWLFGKIFAEEQFERAAYGPLVKPGMYRSYNSIYRQIAIIPRHKPSPTPASVSPNPELPYRVVFNLWKPSRIPTFAKSSPGAPDFRMAITDARLSTVPTLAQMGAMFGSARWEPPTSSPELAGPQKTYQRLQHGWRNVVLAVVDQGVISYLQLSEGAFGEERLYERFDRGNGHNAKRGGLSGGGRGRGKGRGRGRGRGGGGGDRGRGGAAAA
jgi:tRNA-splicing endonuclease subunit Sen54